MYIYVYIYKDQSNIYIYIYIYIYLYFFSNISDQRLIRLITFFGEHISPEQ